MNDSKKIQLVAKNPKVTLVSFTPNYLEIVRWAADVMHKEVGSDPIAYCKNFSPEELKDFFVKLVSEKLATPLEYISTVWMFENVSRAFQQQLTRHRLASYSIQSMRVVEKQGFAVRGDFHIPPRLRSGLKEDRRKLDKYINAMLSIQDLYEDLLEAGLDVEDARGVLPLNIYSTITCCMNLRSLFSTMNSRMCWKTQGEFRDVVLAMGDELRAKMGEVVADLALRAPCEADGRCQMRMENELAIEGKTTRPLCPKYSKVRR